MAEIYESTTSFRAEVDGKAVTVRRGDTVRAGHDLLKQNPGSFRLLAPRFEYEAPKPEPTPEPEPEKATPRPVPVKKPTPLRVPAAKKAED